MEPKDAARGRTGARKRAAPDEVKRGDGPVASKNLALSQEARERLGIHALKLGKAEGELVDWLVCAHLRRWVISDRGGPALEPGSADPDDRASEDGAMLTIGEALHPPGEESRAEAPGEGRGPSRPRRRSA